MPAPFPALRPRKTQRQAAAQLFWLLSQKVNAESCAWGEPRHPEELVHPRPELAACRRLALLPREPLACYYGEKTQQSTTDRAERRRRKSRRGLARRSGVLEKVQRGTADDH